MLSNQYSKLGFVLTAAGVVLVPVGYFALDSVPLAAVGLSSLMFGLTSLILGSAHPYISPSTIFAVMATATGNIEMLLEYLGIRSHTVYLAAGQVRDDACGVIPLSETDAQKIAGKVPEQYLVRCNGKEETLGLIIKPVGCISLQMLETRLEPVPEDIKSALDFLLVGVLDFARTTRVLIDGAYLQVEVSRVKVQNETNWTDKFIGSPTGSIVAAVCAEALQTAVNILSEVKQGGNLTVKLEMLRDFVK